MYCCSIFLPLINLTPKERKQKKLLQELFGQHLRITRIKKKLKQIEVAERCNFSQSGYNQIENGLRNVSIFTLYKISKALNEPLENLINISEIKEVDSIK